MSIFTQQEGVMKTDIFQQCTVTGLTATAQIKKQETPCEQKKTLFSPRESKHWKRLFSEIVKPPSSETEAN